MASVTSGVMTGGAGGPQVSDAVLEEHLQRLYRSQNDDPVVTVANIELRPSSFKSLRPGKWLRGDVLEAYIRKLADEDHTSYVLSTYFCTTLRVRGVDHIVQLYDRTFKKINGFYTKVIIPTHHGDHWTLTVLDRTSNTLRYYDSLLEEDESLVHLVSQVLVEKLKISRRPSVEFVKKLCGNPK